MFLISELKRYLYLVVSCILLPFVTSFPPVSSLHINAAAVETKNS